ncbi:MAG: type III-B CRISPR module RAMP protein Cmr4 [Butyrivibrio sp.]|nr:type III-B CRISPR module RAMP protein Cmr4 [Butyrivibrio sp.]
MKVNVFSARCITNLHVGNGDVNYSIVDQEVEKDPVTGLPMINSSGVKGALREFFESKWGKDNEKIGQIFGTGKDDTAQGNYKFLQADMLFRPLRVTDDSDRSFMLATTKEIVDVFAEKVKGLGGNIEGIDAFQDCGQKIIVEDLDKAIPIKKANGKWSEIVIDTVVIVENMKDYDLPVIARKCLDDSGISQNLWYEEFVPHESIFGFVILTPDEMDEKFKKTLTSEPVQFGANASIGYGLMDITEVKV